MSDHLRVPRELEHLIEKRIKPSRRKKPRRGDSRRQTDLGPLGTLESTADLDQVVLEERRVSPERRKRPDRRRNRRRKSDDASGPGTK